jgi:hypothetical protein
MKPRSKLQDRIEVWTCAISMAAVLGLGPVPAIADQQTALANTLLVESAADDLTTQNILSRGGFERNPLEHTLTNRLVTTAALQLFARNKHTSLSLLRGLITVYPVILINNVRIMIRLR